MPKLNIFLTDFLASHARRHYLTGLYVLLFQNIFLNFTIAKGEFEVDNGLVEVRGIGLQVPLCLIAVAYYILNGMGGRVSA